MKTEVLRLKEKYEFKKKQFFLYGIMLARATSYELQIASYELLVTS